MISKLLPVPAPASLLYDNDFLAWVESLKRDLAVLVPGEATRRVFARVWAIHQLLPATRIFLIEGETGSGKEMVARAIARLFRPNRPLITANLGSIPAPLFEAEMFGHTRGAFTGAERVREGLLLAASGGCFFGDEINNLGLDLQPKLLRILDNRSDRVRFLPVGSEQEKSSDCLFIFASGEPLESAVAQARFRDDLYFRVHAVKIEVPPVRERREEILAFFRFHLETLTRQGADNILIDSAAAQALMEHSWPGNFRELFGKAEQALLAVGFHENQGPLFIRGQHLGQLSLHAGANAPAADPARAARPADPAISIGEELRASFPGPGRGPQAEKFFQSLEGRLARSGLSAGEIAGLGAELGIELSPRGARSSLLRLQKRLQGTSCVLQASGRTKGKRYQLSFQDPPRPPLRDKPYQGIWEAVVDWFPEWGRRILFYNQPEAEGIDLREVQTRGRVYIHELEHPVPAAEILGIWCVQAIVQGHPLVFSDLVTDFSEVERESSGAIHKMRCNIRFKKERPLGNLEGLPFRYSPIMNYEVVFGESGPQRMKGLLFHREEDGAAQPVGRVIFEILDRF
ncbi:MAG: sigma-54-dependent Fis family transcriptional regulator [Planctomycetes bacterium]|nr:sigma-54-dependent Fis family transcriptional regulator [Planctomycetota bacterium]